MVRTLTVDRRGSPRLAMPTLTSQALASASATLLRIRRATLGWLDVSPVPIKRPDLWQGRTLA